MEERVYTISEITRLIKKSLEENPQFSGIWIKGEISNITYHSSGHIYLTLKDENAVISAVFFRHANRSLSFKLEDGMSVLASGSVTVFEKRGSYQFIVAQIRLEGIGELLKRIEQLKKKLLGEGIFDPVHKKKLPLLPRRLGVVTSPTGAAVRDIIKVAMRRFPNLEIIIAPAKVQGSDAVTSIVKGIAELNRPDLGVDVIICGRGGGSFEDLMAFNEEEVIRAFHGSRVPIISAVGHQIDHPLCDEAADYAAPTPSAAAEAAVPVKRELSDEINYLMSRAQGALLGIARQSQTVLRGVLAQRSFRNPMEMLNTRELFLSDVETRLAAFMRERCSSARNRLARIPNLSRLTVSMLREKKLLYGSALRLVEKLSPMGVLRRGYSVTLDRAQRVVKSITGVGVGDSLSIVMQDGTVDCTADSILKEVPFGKKTVGKI